MDFRFTEEQEIFRKAIRGFLKKECTRDYVRECDEKEEYPTVLMDKIAELGWFGLPFPERYGGSGGDIIDVVILFEELGYFMLQVAREMARIIGITGLTILNHGTEKQKEFYIPRISRGELILSFGMTEPNAGSDAVSITTSAIEDGEGFIINGNKVFCSAADYADYIVLVVRTDKSAPRHKGISLFLVDPNAKGVEIRKLRTLGVRSVGTAEVFLSDVRVPKEDLLGSPNKGWDYITETLGRERVSIASICVGAAQSAFDDVLQYAKEREQFGRPLGRFQVIQHKFADMQIDIEAARLFTYRAAYLLREGGVCRKEAAIAKLQASEAYMQTALQGIQIMGGYGYMMEYDMQRHFRDAKLFEIGGGASEIQRNIIARELGL